MKTKIDTLKALGSFLSGLAFLITAILGVVKWKASRQYRERVLGEKVGNSTDMQWNFPDEKKFYY